MTMGCGIREFLSYVCSGAQKRYATLQLCLSGDLRKPQPKIGVVFHGAGKVSNDEKAQYPDNIDVYWQKKAHVDKRVCDEWVCRTWTEFKNENYKDKWALLVQDNFLVQVREEYRQAQACCCLLCFCDFPVHCLDFFVLVASLVSCLDWLAHILHHPDH